MTRAEAYIKLTEFICEQLGLMFLDLDGKIKVFDRDSYLVFSVEYEADDS